MNTSLNWSHEAAAAPAAAGAAKLSSPSSNTPASHTSYLKRLTSKPLLSCDEETTLARRIMAGDLRARDAMVEANMRLVVNIARSYNSNLIPLEDLIQEGAIGLMTAAERFDPARGYRFSTYATHWIRQAISRALDNKAKAIRIPAHVSETLRKMERVRSFYLRVFGEEPTAEQLASELGVSARKISTLMQANQEPVSLDALVGDDDSATLASLLNDETADNPQQAVITAEMQEMLARLLQILTPREREIMARRMGFEGDNAHVLQEIGEQMQISRERVRQIEAKALRKLRHSSRARRLRAFMEN